SLLDPLPHRSFGQVEVSRDLPNGTVPALAQLDDLGLELRRERTALPGLPPHALHGRTSFRGRTPDDGCPSKRARPTNGSGSGRWQVVSLRNLGGNIAVCSRLVHRRSGSLDANSWAAVVLDRVRLCCANVGLGILLCHGEVCRAGVIVKDV